MAGYPDDAEAGELLIDHGRPGALPGETEGLQPGSQVQCGAGKRIGIEMSSNQIRALLIEDDPDDILLLKDSLAEIGLGKIKLDYTDRLSKGLIQLGIQGL